MEVQAFEKFGIRNLHSVFGRGVRGETLARGSHKGQKLEFVRDAGVKDVVDFRTADHNDRLARRCVIEATNHDGDSDTVGSIAGGIVGTYLGLEGIPASFVNRLPMAAELATLAEDVFNAPIGIADADSRYPQREGF